MVSIKDTYCRRSTQITPSGQISRKKQKYIAAAALVIFIVMMLAKKSFKRKQKQSDQTSLSNHKKSNSTAATSAKSVDDVFSLNSSGELGSMLVVPLKSETTIIKYQHIPEKSIRQGHVRYAAFFQDTGDVKDELWKPLSVRSWLEILSSDNKNFESVALQFSDEIKKAVPTYKAFYFETKGVSFSSAPKKQFEFVLVNAPSLYDFGENSPDPDAFEEYLNCLPHEIGVCAFPNLSGDATLISPRIMTTNGNADKSVGTYTHLAAFLRGAEDNQIVQLWNLAADELIKIMTKSSTDQTVWCSTSGMGVAWLHLRLCYKPKYYTYRAFGNET